MVSITTMLQLILKHPDNPGLFGIMQKDRRKNSATHNDAAGAVSQVPTEELIEKISLWAHRYAEKNGRVLNPEGKGRETVLYGLASDHALVQRAVLPLPVQERGFGER